jgi:organic radical activating enzyme
VTTLRVSEVFGPTWQGEGPHTGRVVGFLRLGLCNLHCTWCDTPYTWDTTRFDLDKEAPALDVTEVAEVVQQLEVDILVISGGEPLMQQVGLIQLAKALPGIELHIETNGTISPSPALEPHIAHWSVSPKIGEFGQADPLKKRIKRTPLTRFAAMPNAVFKFVATTVEDLREIDAVADSLWLDTRQVWVMPEGITADATLTRHRELAEAILARRYNTSPRLHVLLWDDRRGV